MDSGTKIVGFPASIQMTMRYAHPTPEDVQRAVDKLGEIFERLRYKDSDRSISTELGKRASSSF